ncbi:MAG: DUF4135 domain-containing protein [Anaerolineae bacterium]|nr:DUF4135 domain-containing protein [Anaerolineae bacterium]
MSAADNYRDTLITIVEKSATLAERLSGEFVPINDPTEAEIIETRLKTWMQTAAQGDPERFRKRLEWDGLTLEQVKPLLGSVRRRDPNAPLPLWAELLETVFQTTQTSTLEETKIYFGHQVAIEFEEILFPFIVVAMKDISAKRATIERFDLQFSPSYSNLALSLLQTLSSISARGLMVAFKTFQTIEHRDSPFVKTNEASEENYLAFVQSMLKGEFESFCAHYSVLARLLATTTLFWIEAVWEMLLRLLDDGKTLDEIFKFVIVGNYLFIEQLQSGLSDFHHDGRTVMRIRFPAQEIIYKPRPLELDVAFAKLQEWFNIWSNPLSPLKTLKFIEMDSYGWVERLFPLKYNHRKILEVSFRQAGFMFGLIHALAANDCHAENVMNITAYPVLIDAETLMHHRVPDIEYHFPDARAAAHAILENSVLRTQFLPKWELGANGQFVDMSALGNEATSPKDYEAEIINGFTEMYHFLMAHREELLAEGSPLEGFKNQRVRYVFRPTQTYQTVLQHTLQPRYLHEGIDRSIQIESLNRVLLAWDEKPVFWDIHKGEAQAMEQMDVPLLTYNSSETSLHIGDITIENVFDRPAYTLVIERLNSMGEKDLKQQIGFMRGSLFCRIAHELPDTEDEIPAVLQNATSLPRELLMSEAGQIADELQARAIWGEDGSATWITLTYHFAANRYQFGQISDGLYDGACGVAFFLAALHHVVGWPGARELALAAIKPLQNRLYHPVLSHRLARNLGVNGPSGLKSITYALRHIREWLDEPRLLEDVRRVESLISPERDLTEQQARRIPENVFTQSTGRWRIATHLPEGVQLWGLYGGRAGVGYELLKMLDTRLPSIPF